MPKSPEIPKFNEWRQFIDFNMISNIIKRDLIFNKIASICRWQKYVHEPNMEYIM